MARPRRILVTGGDGQLGIELQRALAVLGEVVVCRRGDCDLAVSASIRRKVREVGPDLACAVNTVAPLVLGEEASRLGALVVHYSSDYVFDGKKEGAYTEEDEPNPLGVYGRTKRDGERGLMASGARCVIFRTSWVCSTHGKNFVKTILRLASERPELKIVADQWGAPTGAALLADASAHVASHYLLHNGAHFPFGLYHLTASGETTWHELARYVLARASHAGKQGLLSPEQVFPISSAEYPTPAARPKNSRLNTEKFRKAFDLHLPHWQYGIDAVIDGLL